MRRRRCTGHVPPWKCDLLLGLGSIVRGVVQKSEKKQKGVKDSEKRIETSNSGVAEGPRDATQFAKMRDSEQPTGLGSGQLCVCGGGDKCSTLDARSLPTVTGTKRRFRELI